jgi:hypothetical protein
MFGLLLFQNCSKDLRAIGSAYLIAPGFNPLKIINRKSIRTVGSAHNNMHRAYGTRVMIVCVQRVETRCYNMGRGYASVDSSLSETPDVNPL